MAKPGTVLLTGASSGIGLATAELLLAQGYRVLGISRRGSVASLAADLFTPITLDIGNLEQLEQRLKELAETEVIDSFVHAAGQGWFGSIEQFSRVQIDTALRVNLTSAMLICRALVPAWRRRGRGRIVFIGSESAREAGKKGALYSAAKFGLRGFCQALREDCAGDGIQVSLLNPGMVRSAFFDDLSFAPGPNPENAIAVTEVAQLILQVLCASPDVVIDEINFSPRVKSIDFKK